MTNRSLISALTVSIALLAGIGARPAFAQDANKASTTATLWAELSDILPRRGTSMNTPVQEHGGMPPSAAINWEKANEDMLGFLVSMTSLVSILLDVEESILGRCR